MGAPAIRQCTVYAPECGVPSAWPGVGLTGVVPQVVTFDYFGVSAHPNHVAVHTGVRCVHMGCGGGSTVWGRWEQLEASWNPQACSSGSTRSSTSGTSRAAGGSGGWGQKRPSGGQLSRCPQKAAAHHTHTPKYMTQAPLLVHATPRHSSALHWCNALQLSRTPAWVVTGMLLLLLLLVCCAGCCWRRMGVSWAWQQHGSW